MTFQKVVRSGARLADGSLPPEVREPRDVSATLSPFDLGSPSRAVDVVVGTLQARPSRLDADSTGAGHLIAFDPKAGGDRTSSGAIEDGTGITPTLSGSRPHAVAVPSIGAKSGGQGVMDGTQVRRLTPLECERLQGAPDGWTEGQSDSARYRQLGNSVAVPVFEWVGRRLVAVDAAVREMLRGAAS